MKKRLRCLKPCQISGFGIVPKDALIELPEARIDGRILSCFEVAESAEAEGADDAKTLRESRGLDDLNKAALAERAEALKIPVSPKMTKAVLIELIEQAESTPEERV